jgi:hypothetical protein
MNIENHLSFAIALMLAGNFDRWRPHAEHTSCEALMDCAYLTADGIALKLTQALAQRGGEVIEQQWRSLVEDATRNAFIEVPYQGPLVKMGQMTGFVDAVFACTAHLVAPADSDWALAIAKRDAERWRRITPTDGRWPTMDTPRTKRGS